MARLGRVVEKFGIDRVRAGPAALDIIDAQLIESAGEAVFIGGGEIDALRLLSIAQGGVE